jgi:GTPase SAR1 family protein
MMPLYYRNVNAVLLVVDATDPSTWDFVKKWTETELLAIDPKPLLFLAINKTDLTPDQEFLEKVMLWADQSNIHYYQTSACTGAGVVEVFRDLAIELVKTTGLRVKPLVQTLRLQDQENAKCC